MHSLASPLSFATATSLWFKARSEGQPALYMYTQYYVRVVPSRSRNPQSSVSNEKASSSSWCFVFFFFHSPSPTTSITDTKKHTSVTWPCINSLLYPRFAPNNVFLRGGYSYD